MAKFHKSKRKEERERERERDGSRENQHPHSLFTMMEGQDRKSRDPGVCAQWAHLTGLLQVGEQCSNTAASCSAQDWDESGRAQQGRDSRAKVGSKTFGKGDRGGGTRS